MNYFCYFYKNSCNYQSYGCEYSWNCSCIPFDLREQSLVHNQRQHQQQDYRLSDADRWDSNYHHSPDYKEHYRIESELHPDSSFRIGRNHHEHRSPDIECRHQIDLPVVPLLVWVEIPVEEGEEVFSFYQVAGL